MKILSEFENRMQDQPATAESIIKPAAYPRYSHDIPGGILRLNLEYKEYREYQIDRQLKEKNKKNYKYNRVFDIPDIPDIPDILDIS